MEQFSYPAQLERTLRRRTGSDIDVENLGLAGAWFYSIKTYYESRLPSMPHDLVIVYYGSNLDRIEVRAYFDRVRSSLTKAPFIRNTEELWAAMHLKWKPPWLIQGFASMLRMRTFMAVMSALQTCQGWQTTPLQTKSQNERDFDRLLFVKTPEEIVQLVLRNEVKVVLLPEICASDLGKGPDDHQYFHPYYDVFADLARKYAGQGVYYRNLLDSFGPGDAADFVDEAHMNDNGYGHLAEAISDFLIAEEIVPISKSIRPGEPVFSESG